MGGSSKNADFSELAESIVAKGVRVYLFGKEGALIQKAIEDALEGATTSSRLQGPIILAYDQSGDFNKIIQSAFKMAKPEDSISLSPACASFDMFKNSVERGKLFDQIVRGL
jgi:UDP-N-acetylmuramoylalanine--D-glutamate ligase